MKKISEKEALEVVQAIWMRTWGWPDGTEFCGMEAETVNQAMEFLRDRLEKGWRDDPWPKRKEVKHGAAVRRAGDREADGMQL